MTEQQQPPLSHEELTSAVWEALRDVPGIVDLHRNPLQALGERVRLDWRGPVRLLTEGEVAVLEVHVVVAAGRPIPPIVEAAHAALQGPASRLGPSRPQVSVHVDDIAEEDAGSAPTA